MAISAGRATGVGNRVLKVARYSSLQTSVLLVHNVYKCDKYNYTITRQDSHMGMPAGRAPRVGRRVLKVAICSNYQTG